MAIEFTCSSCKQTLRVPDDSAGKSARCPTCGAIMPVPSAPASPAASTSPFGDALPQNLGSAAAPPDQSNPYASPQTVSYLPPPSVAAGISPRPVEVGDILNHAWSTWQRNLGLLIGTLVCVVAINFVIGFVGGILQGALQSNREHEAAAVVGIVANLLANIVQIFLGIGQAQIALKVARHQPAQFSELFSGGDRFLPMLGASIIGGVALLLGFALCIVPGILLMLMFWPFYYVIVDRKGGPIESFSIGYSIAQNNVGTTFLLWLISIGIILLGVVALCVGVLFAAPLVSMMWATAYLMMSGQIAPRAGYGLK